MFSKKISLVGESGQEIGVVVLEHLWADVYGIGIKKKETVVPAKLLADNIKILLDEAESLPARQVAFRLVKDEYSDELSVLLPDIGFERKNDRVEYKLPVDELLLSDEGTPFIWKSAKKLGWLEKDVASLLGEVSVGDPHSEANDDPLLYIQDFLADPVLTAGLECIHVGFIQGEVASLTVVQINPKSGWSRISYMGIKPKFRNQNLGQWIHRYSFKQMKSQGGKLYHGGTVSTNISMIRLFEKHGCKLFCAMEEWSYLTKRSQL